MSWKVLVCIVSVAVFVQTEIVKAYHDHLYRKCDRICKSLGHQINFPTEKSIVAFNARLIRNLHNQPPHAVVVFTEVTLNEGNAYDAQTGTFTAPADGIYSFTWTILTNPGQHFRTLLVLNGRTVGYNNVYGVNHNNYESGSATTLVKMKEHDRVWVSTAATETYATRDWSSFSGFKL